MSLKSPFQGCYKIGLLENPYPAIDEYKSILHSVEQDQPAHM